jgi:Kef-type K+ transport system membrane component KefB
MVLLALEDVKKHPKENLPMNSTTEAKTSNLKIVLAYGLMMVGVVLAYLVIRWYGEGLSSSAVVGAAKTSGGSAGSGDVMLHVLLALIVVIVLARTLGALFRAIHQPPVIGEIIAGIVLGPSVLGRMAPHVASYVLPTTVAPILNVIAQIGVILYMFLVGLELDPKLLKNRGHATVAISHASILAPFLMGAALALLLFPTFSPGNVPFTGFSLFIGVAMSITAFPVRARILTDRGIHKTRIGAIALTCAAVDDVTAWCLLAFVVSVVEAHTAGALSTIVMALGFIAAMAVVVRPAMVHLTFLYGNRGLTQGLMAAIFVALLLSAMTTDLIGIHAIFGAFALGAIIPHDSSLARELTDRPEDLVIVLLLPAFFAFTGLRTQIGLVSGFDQWLICGFIIVVASLGKFGGAAIAARMTGLNWRDSSALGVLMNTRGLMELIVLNIGYDLKIIPPTLFAMLVIMALVTTFRHDSDSALHRTEGRIPCGRNSCASRDPGETTIGTPDAPGNSGPYIESRQSRTLVGDRPIGNCGGRFAATSSSVRPAAHRRYSFGSERSGTSGGAAIASALGCVGLCFGARSRDRSSGHLDRNSRVRHRQTSERYSCGMDTTRISSTGIWCRFSRRSCRRSSAGGS